MLYETVIPGLFRDPAVLQISGLADRAQIYLDSRFVGLLSREENQFDLPMQTRAGQLLTIIVENQGRICYGASLADRKGIIGNVTLGGKVLLDWKMSGLPLDDASIRLLYQAAESEQSLGHWRRRHKREETKPCGRMSLWVADFRLSSNNIHQRPLDTFVKLAGWNKGVLFVNGVSLGRYWPIVGPQETLYLPSELLINSPGRNNSDFGRRRR